MAFSIYEIKDYSDMAKPSDLLGENYYLQDVFHQTRPELMNFNDKSIENEDSKRDPFFKERDRDEKEDKGDHELSDQKYVYNPHNWDSQESILVKDRRYTGSFNSVQNVLSLYFLENNPQYLVFKKSSKIRTAASMADLMRFTSKFSRKRSPKTNATLIKSPKNNDSTWQWKVRGYEQWSESSGHTVTVKLEKDPSVKDIRNLQVRVSCTCPFWQYYGPAFNSNTGEYSYDAKSVKSPDSRDPMRKNLICKHVYAVGLIFQKYASKNNLDTYKEVDELLESLDEKENQFLPEITSEGIREIIRLLPNSEKNKIESILKKYEVEDNDSRKEKIWEDLLKSLKEILDTKDKSFLQKLLNKFKSFFSRSKNKKKSSVKKASISNIIDMYKKETGESYGDL
jgi:hypothetical protein